jgi:hypothetical protein
MRSAPTKGKTPSLPMVAGHRGLSISDQAGDDDRPGPENSGNQRQEFILRRLAQADGLTYDELCRAVITAFPMPSKYVASTAAVREVRWAMWSMLVVTEPDESVWLTPAGWAALADQPQKAGAR